MFGQSVNASCLRLKKLICFSLYAGWLVLRCLPDWQVTLNHLVRHGKKGQLDATDGSLLQNLLFAQHVSGTIMPIIRSSRVLYRWLLPVVLGAVKMEDVIYKLGSISVLWVLSCVIGVCLNHVECRGGNVWVSRVVESGFLQGGLGWLLSLNML